MARAPRDADLDEDHVRLLTYEAARGAYGQRSRAVGVLLSGLDRISADAAQSSGGVTVSGWAGGWADDAEFDEIDRTASELLARQACYRAASAAIENPIANSLTEFLV